MVVEHRQMSFLSCPQRVLGSLWYQVGEFSSGDRHVGVIRWHTYDYFEKNLRQGFGTKLMTGLMKVKYWIFYLKMIKKLVKKLATLN